MKKLIRKRAPQQRKFPQAAPCNHIPPAFPTVSGKLRVIANPRIVNKVAFIALSASVWCVRCGWVKISDELYEHYKEFDGNQTA